MIRTLFSDDVVTVESTGEASLDTLRPEELACLGRVVEKRAREFAAGRACARSALARLGFADVAIPIEADRLAAWPPGVVGSITHCASYCGVAVARRGAIVSLGVDAEVGPELDPPLIPLVCRASEVEALRVLSGLTPGEGAMLVFSAKESVYKSYFPVVRRVLDFHDVEIELALDSPRGGVFTARVLPGPAPMSRLRGRFARDDVRVYTGVTLRAG